jgi:hypothetical protein
VLRRPAGRDSDDAAVAWALGGGNGRQQQGGGGGASGGVTAWEVEEGPLVT